MTAAADAVLAHYGGAPEVLTVALPLVVFAGFVLMERRARRLERGRTAPDQSEQPEQAEPLGD